MDRELTVAMFNQMVAQYGPEDLAGAIEDMADLIEVFGWVQGRAGNTWEGFCISGAATECILIRGASTRRYGKAASYELRGAVMDALARSLPGRSGAERVPQWNDAAGRTEFEVIDFLRRTAKDLRNQGA